MKKYLLSLLIVGLLFIGFSNAGNITFIGNGNGYSPSQITLVSDGDIDMSSYSCSSDSNCDLSIDIDEIDYCSLSVDYYCYDEEDIDTCEYISNIYNCDNISAGTYDIYVAGAESFDSITLSSSSFEDNTGGGTGGDDNTGGGSGGNNVIGGIINGGTSQLSPVVLAIYSVMLQFIPYVVYIGIGILLCTLGFYAIKWLVNWLTSKITNYFK